MGGEGNLSTVNADVFIQRWGDSSSAERANYQLFLTELCDFLGVERPAPTTADDTRNRYVFEKAVTFPNGDGTTSAGRIDLYRRGHFVCETKQGSEKKKEEAGLTAPKVKHKTGHGVRGTQAWDAAMVAARGQAERYVRAIPDDNPPFVLVIDVGYSIEVYSDFSRLGKIYTPFPDARSHRIYLKDLGNPELRDRLKLVWTDPLALDPSRRTAKVTREIADQLAKLAKSLEGEGHEPEHVAGFLMRCLFTLFAEDVKMIADDGFTKLLADVKPDQFVPMVQDVWKSMDAGTFSPALRQKLMRFNGGLFAEQSVLPLNAGQIKILHEAAIRDWREVEPAIFGTLLERALNPTERHKLGAHYTPRAYVERLVLPTIIEPLRDEWDAAKAAAITLASAGNRKDAVAEVQSYLRHLCDTVVLDPACGTGNFLYVTLEHMKRLEGEVRDQLLQFGEAQADFESMGLTVDPHQFKGIEINPRAAHIADLVLWIGYLQWHFRVYGNIPPREPVLRAFHNIENRDAVLAYDRKELVLDNSGKPVSHWDGRTMKTHPVTGENVPNEIARVPVYRYVNPRKAEWPKADYIVGNPPFVANRNMRGELGDGYVAALAEAYPEVTQAIDLVMYFWKDAAEAVYRHATRRSGLITTSRFRLQQNQSVVTPLVGNGIELSYAIPDHPWLGEGTDASVRVAMTVVSSAADIPTSPILLLAPDHDQPSNRDTSGNELDANSLTAVLKSKIPSDLSPSVDISKLVELEAWNQLCHAGMKPYAKTLLIDDARAKSLFDQPSEVEQHAPKYLNGKDVAQGSRSARVLDFFGTTEARLRSEFPKAYQYLYDYTREERKEERNPRLRRDWWLFEANRKELRVAIAPLKRFIVTVENSPNRYFVFVDSHVLPDQKLRAVACDDGFVLGILSSTPHAVFAKRLGGRHGVANTPVYNTRCATTFPFPIPIKAQESHIRNFGEQLDAHRKKQQAAHPGLTITDMYNVLEKLRAGEPLTAKDKVVHEQGLVSVLRQIHDELDAAVFAAYGWPAGLSDEQILEKLVALNAERAAEEERGLIRWLRPEFQNKAGRMTQPSLDLPGVDAAATKKRPVKSAKLVKQPWPTTMADQAKALRAALATGPAGRTADEIAKSFRRAKVDRVAELLETLASLGQARKADGGRFSA